VGFSLSASFTEAMECSKEQNLVDCNCTYDPCSRKGICCQCIRYHKRMRQLPGCVFPDDVERTWDRSYETFARLVNEGRV
jgi:hypothetical protein